MYHYFLIITKKYGILILFGEWFANKRNIACGVGIRSDESLNIFITIVNKKKITYHNQGWTTKISTHVYNAYPIYDWKTQDIWIANGKFGWKYNKLYNLMHWQGRSLHQQRICQPYGDDQKQGLDLFHECEPKTWNKVVERVAGANMGSLYRGNPLCCSPRNEIINSFY
jgi:predicted phosphoadenosine phosphosulfate sulfurtransferase